MYPRILNLLERKDKQKTKRRRRCSRCSEIPSLSSILDTDKVYLSFLSFWNPNAPNFFAFFEALVKQVSYFHKKATPRNSYKKLLKLRHLFPQHPLLFTEIVKMRFPLFALLSDLHENWKETVSSKKCDKKKHITTCTPPFPSPLI